MAVTKDKTLKENPWYFTIEVNEGVSENALSVEVLRPRKKLKQLKETSLWN